MAVLLAAVHDGAEAATAIAAGFAGIVVEPGADIEVAPAVLVARVEAAAVAGGACLHIAGGDRPRRLRIFAGAPPSGPELDSLFGQVDGVVVGHAGRLPDAVPVPDLARIVEAAHARGLVIGLQGALEAPDVPRLLALGADILILDTALRVAGALDPARCRMLAALETPAAPRPTSPAVSTARDRIFVRDMELAVEIGAYDSERGRTQRVRFSVEAELEPLGDARDGMGAIVSYDLMIDAVRRLATGRHVDFVETLAEEIAAAILPEPRVAVVRVVVEKLDVGPGAVGIAIERRSDAAGV